jgi:sugar phosphate isomerase/epimerase
MLNTSCVFHDEALIEENLDEGRRAIDLANQMDIPAIRVFGDSIPKGAESRAICQVKDCLGSLCAYAKGLGDAKVLLEIHGNFNTVDVLSELASLVDSGAFGLIWDIEHSWRAYGKEHAKMLKPIIKLVSHVHAKDFIMRQGKPRPCLPGEGCANLAEVIETLESDGYAGLYSFEWEKRWIPELPEPEEAFPMYVGWIKSIAEGLRPR